MNRRNKLGVAIVGLLSIAAVPLFASMVDVPETLDGAGKLPTADDDRTTTPHLEFTRAEPDTGINYSGTFDSNDGMIGRGGVYATDYDTDGWPDLLAIGGEKPVLFENAGGEFVRSGELSRVQKHVKSGHFLDYDADGDDDLLLLPTEDSPMMFENTGTLEESRAAGEAGDTGDAFERVSVGLSNLTLDVPTGATSTDYDGDGCQDLFIYQNGDWSDGFPGNAENREAVLEGSARPNVTDGNSNFLFRGTCGGFENVTAGAGIQGDKWSLAASFVDLTGDRRPDIHVANDFSHDALYRNQGNGSFERVDLGPSTDRNAMSSEVADLTGDRQLDVYVTNIYFSEYMHLVGQDDGREVSMEKSSLSLIPEGNNLLVNGGNGTFSDRAPEYGMRKGGWGWAASAADFDNDGRRDLIHTTSSDIPIAEYSSLGYNHPQVWEGTETGFEKRNASGIGFDETNGRGVVSVDADRDGDLDVVVASSASYESGVATDGPFVYYENVGAGNRSLSLTVEREGRTSIGARVYVTTNETTRLRVLNSRADFFSQEPRRVHVGLGNETVEEIRVVWPDGTERAFSTLPESRFLRVTPEGIQSDPAESE